MRMFTSRYICFFSAAAGPLWLRERIEKLLFDIEIDTQKIRFSIPIKKATNPYVLAIQKRLFSYIDFPFLMESLLKN